MKAKEIAKEFIDNTPPECIEFDKDGALVLDRESEAVSTIAKIGRQFIDDFHATIDERNIQTDEALVSLITEFDKRWKATRRLLEEEYGYGVIKEDGFIALLEELVPEVYNYYKLKTTRK